MLSFLFNRLSRFVIDFLPRSNCLLTSRLQSPSAVILRAQEEICHYFHLFPFYLLWNDEAGCHDLSCCCCFLIFSFNRAFSLTSYTLIRSFFGFLLLSAIRVVSYTCLGLLITSHRIISIYTPGQCLLHLPSLIP